MFNKGYHYIKNDKFLKNNIIYFVGSLVIAVLNYLYYPVIGRLVSIGDFGEIQTLISIVIQLGIVFNAFAVAITNLVANDSKNTLNQDLVSALQKVSYIITISIFIIIVASSFALKSFFKFNSLYPFIALAAFLIINIAFTLNTAYIQGRHDFKGMSVAGIIYAGIKIIASAILVYIGLRTFGAIAGIAIAQGIGVFYLYNRKKKHYKQKSDKSSYDKKVFSLKLRKEYGYLAFIFIVYFTSSLLYTADALVVKHYFTPIEAGLYSSIATAARTIFFITGSVSAVLIPSITLKNSRKENIKTLSKSLIIIGIIGGSTLLVFSVEPALIIKTLMGNKFIPYSYLLPRLSLAVFLASVVNLLFTYFISLREYTISLLSIFILIVLTMLIALNHSTLSSIINVFIQVNLLTIFLLSGYILYNVGKSKSNAREKVNINNYSST